MKKVSLLMLSMLMLTSASVFAAEAEKGMFGASFSLKDVLGQKVSPEGEVHAGPLRYKLNAARIAKYLAVAGQVAVTYDRREDSKRDDDADAGRLGVHCKMPKTNDAGEVLVYLGLEMARDVAYDSTECLVDALTEGQHWTVQEGARLASYLLLHNATHNLAQATIGDGDYGVSIPFLRIEA